MVVKLMRDHNGEHMREPLTRAEAKRLAKELVIAMVGFGIVMVVALAVALKAQNDTAKQTDRIAALVVAIQQSRFEATREACQDTNDRNRETLLALGQVTTTPTGGLSKKQQAQQIKATRFLIGKMLPVHADCDEFARQRVATLTP